MNFRRRLRILESRKSPSTQMMKRTYNRVFTNGGIVQDFTANVENLRTLSRILGYDNIDRGKTDPRRNSLQYSEDFSQSVWSKDGTVTLSQNADINPVDFQNTSTKLTLNSSGNADFRFYQSSTIIGVGSTITLSIYVKSTDFQYFHIRFISNLQYAICHNNSNGVITAGYYDGTVLGSTPLASSSTLINGYYRVSITIPYILNPFILFAPSTSATNSKPSGSSINGISYVYGAQLEVGSLVSEYQKVSNNIYKTFLEPSSFTYVPSSYGEGKNFVEVHNKRNLLSWSEDFSNSFWLKNNITVTSNSSIAPNGTLTACLYSENTADANHLLQLANPVENAYPIGTTLTWSVYLKSNGAQWVILDLYNGGDYGAWFDISNGIIGNIIGLGTQPKIVNIGNGWFRCSITKTTTSSSNTDLSINSALSNGGTSNRPGTGTSRYYIWGAQLEQSNGAGMYLPKTNITLSDNVDFTFTRPTTATVTNKLGVIEDSCYNLFQRSEEFDNSFWAKSSAIITANGTTAPNKTLTADKYIESAANAVHRITTSLIMLTNTIYTFSVYLKAGERNFVRIADATSVTNAFNVNLTTGTFGSYSVGTPVAKRIENVGNGWWRVSITYNTLANTIAKGALWLEQSDGVETYLGDGVSGVYIWGAQIELGSIPRQYLKTTNRLNMPRLDYSRNLYTPSLLTDRAGYNLILWSEDFTNAAWLKLGTTISANTNLNPFGVSKSYYLLEDNTGANHAVRQLISSSLSIGISYKSTYYIKKADDSWVQLYNNSGSFTNAWVNFNFDTGLFGNNAGGIYDKIDLGNGWWAISITSNCTNTSNAVGYIAGTNNVDINSNNPSYTGTVGHRICDIAAYQISKNTEVTPYTKTTTLPVTRGVENNYIDLWNNAMLNKTNWTLFWEGYLYDGSGVNISFALSDSTGAGSDTNQIGWYGSLIPFYNISNTRTNDISRLNNGIVNRFLMQYNNGILNCYVNGINVWSNQTVPVFDYRYLVLNSGGSSFATDKISIWPRTLSNTESVRITTKMVAYYKLDSNSVDTLRLNNGIDTSISYSTAGKVGNSATFNVASSFISVPQSTDFDFSNSVSDIPFSVSMWINRTATTGTYMILLAKETSTLASFNIRFGSGAGNQLEVVLVTSAGNYKWWQYPGTYTNATWYHLVVTYDGSGKDSGVKLYLNNVLKTPNMQNLGTYVKMPIIKAPLTIGQSGYGGNRFNGKMDELGIWKDYILSELEITDLYNKGLAGLPIL